jgi:hypothetical protein
VFEIQRHGLSTDEYCSRLDGFFGQLPRDLRYAIEIRTPGLLGSEYQRVLERHGMAHVYNQWSYMPALAEQPASGRLHSAVHSVPPPPLKMSYEAAKKRAEPYTRIVGELPEMRRETMDLVRKTVAENCRANVLVNNRSEGNEPLTIQGLADQLRDMPT